MRVHVKSAHVCVNAPTQKCWPRHNQTEPLVVRVPEFIDWMYCGSPDLTGTFTLTCID